MPLSVGDRADWEVSNSLPCFAPDSLLRYKPDIPDIWYVSYRLNFPTPSGDARQGNDRASGASARCPATNSAVRGAPCAEHFERVVNVQDVLRSILPLTPFMNEYLLGQEADGVCDLNPSGERIGLEVNRPWVM